MDFRYPRPGFIILSWLLALVLPAILSVAHAAKAPLSLQSVQVKNGKLLVRGQARGVTAVDLYDLEGRRLGRVPVVKQRLKVAMNLPTSGAPCGVVAVAAGTYVTRAVNKAPGCGSLRIARALWSGKRNILQVAGSSKGLPAGPVELYDLDGNLLDTSTPKKRGQFRFDVAQNRLRAGVPCAVRVAAGRAGSAAAVARAPAGCTVLPLPTDCAITEPAPGSRLGFNQPVTFRATIEAPDPKALPLKVEWDFAGGVMGHPTATLGSAGETQTQATFIRDNSDYRVRFAVTDARGERCEAALDVAVGTPPSGLPPKVPEQPAPPIGGELSGMAGDLVVLPFEDWTMQTYTDSRLEPNVFSILGPQVSTLNALVYRKARLPERVGPEQADLVYSAASNPADPVGPDSINSTSQNWPVGARFLDALLQKSDLFEPWDRPADQPPDPKRLYNLSFIDTQRAGVFSVDPASEPAPADEGYRVSAGKGGDEKGLELLEPASRMPGISAPYSANDPQPFGRFPQERSLFSTQPLPLSDVDDRGRVNSYPLLRSEVRAKGVATVLASTDAVLTAARDLHCRECHEKGGVAADPSVHRTGRFSIDAAHNANHDGHGVLFDAGGPSLFEREYAAQLNIASLHDLYDPLHLLALMRGEGYGTPQDSDLNCNDCHAQVLFSDEIKKTPIVFEFERRFSDNISSNNGQVLTDREGGRNSTFRMDNSAVMHKMHGQLVYTDNKTGIRRLPSGRFQRWDLALDGPNPNPLFPVKDAQGNPLPMEQNCLRCHGGQREQAYRDHHYTVGLTCYQCHGDMLAMGNAYTKSALNPDGHDHRTPWFDEPECGACHIGHGNEGKDATGGFYSAGARTLAFEVADQSATPRVVDRSDPDGGRFAVPFTRLPLSQQDNSRRIELDELQTPLFRVGKDTHGNVACAACHGGTHALWPNRDPEANDNVTARQLQGYPGNIVECAVCHTADSFVKKDDLDGGVYSGQSRAGILGGPHNLHPVNDPNWWKQAAGDTPTSSGKTLGGWHNDYAKLPGAAGEDQCAACHGNDHKGTRLSKTRVDRVFQDENGKPVKVKAGAVIGCDLCHTIEKSCTNSPNPRCGTAEGYVSPPGNQAPVFSSTPVTAVVKGQSYAYTAQAVDPEGEPLTYRLSSVPVNNGLENNGLITIDPASGAISGNWAAQEFVQTNFWTYVVTATDKRGGAASQSVLVKLTCPAGLLLNKDNNNACDPLLINSTPPAGLDFGQTYRYAVKVEQGEVLPLQYALADAPPGMAIDPTGVLSFDAGSLDISGLELGDSAFASATVTVRDSKGNEVSQGVGFSVCTGSQHWDPDRFGCFGPVSFTSSAPGDANLVVPLAVGDIFRFQVTAAHDQNLPITYNVAGGPERLSINASTGLIDWTADEAALTAGGFFSPTISASDGAGGLSKQSFTLIVCPTGQHYDNNSGSCL